MISGIRDTALALACVRQGLPAVHGRGIDLLPNGVTAQFQDSLVRWLDLDELWRTFRAAVDGLVNEIRNVDEELAVRLQGVLSKLPESAS
jgi:hypothetical protein